MSASELPAWWEAVHQEPEHSRDFLLIALCTGMRRAEIAGLKWEYVDLENRAVHIPKTKNGDPLDIPISKFVSDLLTARRDMNKRGSWVFPSSSKTGHIVETKTFTARVSERCGTKFTLHDLRRTFVSIAESLDVPHYALKRLLNHRTDSDVTGGYIVINTNRLREPVERVSKRIMELVGLAEETQEKRP